MQLCGDSNSHFYNNTVVNNTDTSGSNKTGGIKDWGAGANVVNNLFYNNGTGSNDHGAIWNLSGEDSGNPSYNYIYPASCGSGSCKNGSNVKSTCAVSGNCPGFVNLGGADFRLLSNSPAINSGTLLSLASLDLLGLLRIAPYDLGAYESWGACRRTPRPRRRAFVSSGRVRQFTAWPAEWRVRRSPASCGELLHHTIEDVRDRRPAVAALHELTGRESQASPQRAIL